MYKLVVLHKDDHNTAKIIPFWKA